LDVFFQRSVFIWQQETLGWRAGEFSPLTHIFCILHPALAKKDCQMFECCSPFCSALSIFYLDFLIYQQLSSQLFISRGAMQ
jgi:hypothetical protein